MITHHLSDKLLMAYSAGTLPEAFSLAVAAHVELCDDCRARLTSFDAVGGAVLDATGPAPAPLSDGALAATLARIKTTPPVAKTQPTRMGDAVLPEALAKYVGGGTQAIKWRSVGNGVRQAILPTSGTATARLLYIPAGMAVPDHGHKGLELTMVLQGAFADDDDRFARGDVEIADDAVEHQPVAEAGADCICLAVTEAPLKFRDLLPRLAQPFLRI